MLKKKLNARGENAPKKKAKRNKLNNEEENPSTSTITTSEHFTTPFWKMFFDLECALNVHLQNLQKPAHIKYIYNPVEYAKDLHCAYLRRFVNSPKRLVFIGMNPGPNGMAQTGVPFGNINTVRDFMGLIGTVEQPDSVHPKRLIRGMECTVEEPSGVRIWSLFKSLAGGSLETFEKQCCVLNYCPLVFYDHDGRNITPSELKYDYKAKIRQYCLEIIDKEFELLQPEIIVAVGEYVHSALKTSNYAKRVKVLRLPHPSPRSLHNQDWPEKAAEFMKDNDLIRYIQNEVKNET